MALLGSQQFRSQGTVRGQARCNERRTRPERREGATGDGKMDRDGKGSGNVDSRGEDGNEKREKKRALESTTS